MKRYLVTAALPYANGPLHIGHLAGAYLTADIYTRLLKMKGKDVVFVCGSDEHGAAITMKAKKEGISPQDIIDKYHNLFEDTFKKVGINFDVYHRTSSPLHHETSQDFFRTLHKNGAFIEQTSEQYFDEKAQQFLADRYITGTCPNCQNEEAYGDQCEKCGSTLSPLELINPKSTLTGEKPILKTTTHWFLSLDKSEAWLKEWVETGAINGEQLHEPKTWKNHVLGQCKSWIDGGLQPRAMTRDLEWGVDVPQEIPGAEGKKLYVWLDAPIGYISATKQWSKNTGKDWEPYWKDKDTQLVHFIGKDNIVFHCIIFPAILKEEGSYILPHNVPANQFLNLEGRKISTSKGWAIWVHEFVEEFKGLEDVLRYYMIKIMPEQRDSEFTWKGFQEANNSELVGTFANFIHRVLTLTGKYYDGVVPDFGALNTLAVEVDESSDKVSFDSEMELLGERMKRLAAYVERYEFRNALSELMEIASRGNQILQFNEPWKQYKTNPEAVKVVMNVGLQYVAALAYAARPFLPFTADKMSAILNLETTFESGEWTAIIEKLSKGLAILEVGHKVNKSQHLFTRIDDKVIDEQIAKLEASENQETSYEAIKETTTFEDFSKIDLRTGKIIMAEKIKKAKKLLKLTVDLGFETRTVVSGIAEFYTPEAVIGQEVVLVANLAPRKLRGVESQGMILMAEDDKGTLAFVSPKADFGGGFVVR